MFIKSLSVAVTLTLGLTAFQSAFALTPPEDGQETCLIGENVAAGKAPVVAMLEAIATCNANIETIIRAAITAAPHASADLVQAAIAASPDNALLIVQTAMIHAPSAVADDILTVALEAGIDPADILQATAAGVEDTTVTEDTTVATETTTTETTATITLPTTTSPTPINGGVSPS